MMKYMDEMRLSGSHDWHSRTNNRESAGFITYDLTYYFESQQKAVDLEESEIFCASWNECFLIWI